MADANKITFPILSDPDLKAIKAFDLVHEGMGENGASIARPAEFLIDASGTVRWVDLTESFWVRVTPEQMLEATSTLPQ